MNSPLYVRRFSLNLIHDLIGNQCSDLSRDLDSESLLDLVTTRASQCMYPKLYYIFCYEICVYLCVISIKVMLKTKSCCY